MSKTGRGPTGSRPLLLPLFTGLPTRVFSETRSAPDLTLAPPI
jgi:hypothetical protein